MDNEFYSRIVYRKNAFLELAEYLGQNYYGKKILLISTKSLVNSNLTEIMNAISFAKCSFKHYIAKSNFSDNELKSITNIVSDENFDLYIVFGGVRATMVTKYFANIFNVPYIVCPSMPSGIGYFSNICINPYDSARSFLCEYPEKVFISEVVIKTCPKKFVKQGVYFILSFEEYIATCGIENILLDKHYDCTQFENIISKLKKELKGIMSMDIDEKLKLMDLLIDLANECSKIDLFKNSVFNLYTIMQKVLKDNNEFLYGGECYLLSSNALLCMYTNFFKQKDIKRLEMPNVEKLVKNIKNNSIFYKKINNISFFNDILNKKELLIRLNNLKEEFYFQCNKRLNEQNKMLDIIKSYDNIFVLDSPQIKNVFTAINVFPFITENNYVVTLMGGLGYFNKF